MSQPQEPATWFHNNVVSGLQFLWALGLDGTPAAETATLTATAFVHAMWQLAGWDEQQDAARIAAGFSNVAGRNTRWPSPRQVYEAMPSRHMQRQLAGSPTPMPQHVRDFIAARTRRRTDQTGAPK